MITDKLELTAENVEQIFMACLFEEGEPKENFVLGEGVMLKAGFHPDRLSAKCEDIKGLLSQLPDDFRTSAGGGMSFLNACVTRDGKQWGEHRSMDQLLTLGVAAGLAKILLPREAWAMLPGGMPYFCVNL